MKEADSSSKVFDVSDYQLGRELRLCTPGTYAMDRAIAILKFLEEEIGADVKNTGWKQEEAMKRTWTIVGAADVARSFKWRAAFVCAACFSAVSCFAPLRDNTPALVESRAKDIVVVIDVLSVRSFERDGCFGYFKTESHWGTRSLTDGNLKLVHLVTDGNVVLMPNEAQANVGSDARGDLFVPAYPYEISWLPCGTNAFKKHVKFTTPVNRFGETWQEPFMPSPREVLEQDALYFVTIGERRYPRFGIPIDSISKFLSDEHPEREAFRCFEQYVVPAAAAARPPGT